MNRTLARWMLRAYSRAWRERYGEEFESLLQAGPGSPRTILDILLSALRERGSPRYLEGVVMTECPTSILMLSKQPSALLPMAMSIAALTVVLVRLATIGVVPHLDEGVTAHTWQLLMLLQVPVIAWFVSKWSAKTPRLVLGVLGIQATLALVAIAPVYSLGL